MQRILMLSSYLVRGGLAALVICGSAHAQPPDSTWGRTYGGSGLEECLSAQQTDDGGYVLGGWTESYGSGNQDYWLVKVNSAGVTSWSRSFGGASGDHGVSVVETADGGFALAGWAFSFGAGIADFWLVKTNSDGDSLWSRAYGGTGHDECRVVQQTADQGFLLAGGTYSFGAGDWDFWVVKTDSGGDSLWSRTLGGPYEDYCTSARQTTDGGYVLAGWTDLNGAGIYDYWLVKLDANGDSIWSRTYGNADVEWCWTVLETSDGGFMLGGAVMPSTFGPMDIWIVKTNTAGEIVWEQRYGGENSESCAAILETANHDFVLVGGTWSFGAGASDIWLLKAAANGDSIWSRTFGGHEEEYGTAILQTANGEYVVAGATSSFGAGYFDMMLVKTGADATGAEPSTAPLPANLSLGVFPNPFNPSTEITFNVPRTAHASLRIYDVLGREVMTLMDGVVRGGSTRLRWDAAGTANGIYFVRLTAAAEVMTKKIVLSK